MRLPRELVSGAYIRPCVEGERVEAGLIKLEHASGEYYLSRYALKQVRSVLENHIEFLQEILNNNPYEDIIEALAQVSKDTR